VPPGAARTPRTHVATPLLSIKKLYSAISGNDPRRTEKKYKTTTEECGDDQQSQRQCRERTNGQMTNSSLTGSYILL